MNGTNWRWNEVKHSWKERKGGKWQSWVVQKPSWYMYMLRFAAFKLMLAAMFVLGVRSSRGKSKNYIPIGI